LAEVRLQEGESLENALRRFKRKVQQEDIIREVKRHSFYLKPGENKRVKEALARKRARKKSRKRIGLSCHLRPLPLSSGLPPASTCDAIIRSTMTLFYR
jgi:small subunit ribosomal protein S21